VEHNLEGLANIDGLQDTLVRATLSGTTRHT
jgi:hypothetical protein